MRLPPRLDRLWLWAIGISFVIMVPIWLIEWVQDFGALNVFLFFFAIFVLGMARRWPSTG